MWQRAFLSFAPGLSIFRTRYFQSRRLLDETEIFLNTPNFDNFLDAAEEIAAHAAGIWSVVVVAYNAMNDIILTDRFNEFNEILSLEFFYALYNYIYPGEIQTDKSSLKLSI